MNNKAYIDVDINNNPELLWLILDTLPYMNGWNCDGSIFTHPEGLNPAWKIYFNNIPTYLCFDLVLKIVLWHDKYPIPTDATEIKSTADLSTLLEFINELAETVQNIPVHHSPFKHLNKTRLTQKQIDEFLKVINNDKIEVDKFDDSFVSLWSYNNTIIDFNMKKKDEYYHSKMGMSIR